jgi:hypothetical protein
MALFLIDHCPMNIMILGSWKSEAFMDYIRPRVLEWTDLMSQRDEVADQSLAEIQRDCLYQGYTLTTETDPTRSHRKMDALMDTKPQKGRTSPKKDQWGSAVVSRTKGIPTSSLI